MMTEMTRYKQQANFEDDETSIGSARTEDLATGTTRIRYHMGSHYWRSRTKLEKFLLIGWGIFIITIIVLVAIFHTQTPKSPVVLLHNHETVFGPCQTEECVMIAGRILSRMNLSVDPCDDFYQYSCGEWIASSVRPEGKPAWGTLSQVASNNQVILRKALESDEESASEAEEKAKAFYRSCRDYNQTIEKRGAEPIKNLLKEAGGWTLSEDWNVEGYDLQADVIRSNIDYNSGALLSWGVAENDKKSNTYVLEFDQGGLLLSARNYYLNESEKAITEAYVKYIAKVGVLLGAEENQSRDVAEDIVAFETSLAEMSTPDDDRRDNEKLYHNMTLRELSEKAPFMDWAVFVNSAFKRINRVVPHDQEIVVYAPEYLEKLSDFLHNQTLTEKGNTSIHNYLTWHILKNYIGYLSRDFREAYSILEKAQVGISGFEENWRECVAVTDASFGDAVGAMFVRNAFSKSSKDMAVRLLKMIRISFRINLDSVSWMDPKTKAAALEKADSIVQMIGYSDSILNPNEMNKKFADLKISEDKFFESNINVTNFKVKENLSKLFKPVNKTKWDMTAPTVNAYYSPTRNSIVFPAGILQPPFFDKNNPQALNFGAVGVVMGHELSHAFDDQGRKYDKDGNLHSWWNPATTQQFNLRSQCMISQYSNYSLRSEHLKGKLTLGENIADNGGLKASFHAYKKWNDHMHSQDTPNIPDHHSDITLPGLNLSQEQLFFLGFSQVWCTTMTNEVAHLEILKDSHVPPEFRVRGTLSNSQEFAKVFRCPLGSNMNPKTKCRVW